MVCMDTPPVNFLSAAKLYSNRLNRKRTSKAGVDKRKEI